MTNLREVAAFLLGEGELDGVSFGDPHPTERGNYWWRKHLRAALAQPEQEQCHHKFEVDQEAPSHSCCQMCGEVRKQPEQEPVAWITDGGKGELWWHQSVKFDDDGNLIGENPDDIPLYTAPPQREWQGLTDEEMFSLWVKCPAETEDRFAFARAIEAQLKGKNT